MGGVQSPCCSNDAAQPKHETTSEKANVLSRTQSVSSIDDENELAVMPGGFDRSADLMNKERAAISAEAYGDWNKKITFIAPTHIKTESQAARLKSVLKNCFMFSSLDETDLVIVVGAMREVLVDANKRCIKEGEDGDCLYVVERGNLSVFVKQPDGSEKMVREYAENAVFGELALLYNCPRQASVDSQEESCTLWSLDRETFNAIVKDAAQTQRQRYDIFLSKVPILAAMDETDRGRLAECLRIETYETGQDIVIEGQKGDAFYIIEEGAAVATKDGRETLSYGPGDYFGELALIKHQVRVATVTAKSHVKVLSIDSVSFNRLMHTQSQAMANRATTYATEVTLT